MLVSAASFWPLASSVGDSRVLDDSLFRGVSIPERTQANSLGTAVAGIGDFNGDGRQDFAVAAPSYDRQGPSEVYVLFGRAGYPEVLLLDSGEVSLTIWTDAGTLGVDLIPAGDLDGDGLSDLYIHQLNPGSEPYLYLLYGSAQLQRRVPAEEIGVSVRGALLTGVTLPARSMRNPIASLADFNGDGIPDLAFGEPTVAGPANEHGMVTILFGSRDWEGSVDVDLLIETRAGVRILGSTFSDDFVDGFGAALCAAGDVNGDGLSDLIVSDPKFTTPVLTVVGRVYLIFGSEDLPPLLRVDDLDGRGVTIENLEDDREILRIQDVFGNGDLNGDGFSEFGFSLFEQPGVLSGATGRILVVQGRPDLPSRVSFAAISEGELGFELRPSPPARRRGFGEQGVMVPDEDGDGQDELFMQRGTTGDGEALVVSGKIPIPATALERALHELRAPQPGRIFTSGLRTIAAAGDVNADSVPDYLIGFPEPNPLNDPREGRVFVVFGGFERDVLSLRQLAPRRAPVGESAMVTVAGTGFVSDMQVLFGDLPAAEVEVVDPHTAIVRSPVVAASQTVDVTVVHPDSRRVVRPSFFSFAAVSRLSIAELSGLLTFRVGERMRISPEVLGDVDGDGLTDYALRRSTKVQGDGVSYLVYGGTSWTRPVVDEGTLAQASVRFRNQGGNAPWLLPFGDIDGDGAGEYAVTTADYTTRRVSEFAIVFEAFPVGEEVEFRELAVRGKAALYWSTRWLDHAIHNPGDFDGDGAADLVVRSIAVPGGGALSEVLLLRGPVEPGENVNLESLPAERLASVSDALSPAGFGESLSPAGDIDGDGLGDVAYHDRVRRRAVVVLFGHADPAGVADLGELVDRGLAAVVPHEPATMDSAFLKPAGDVNADGLSDLLLHGASGLDDNRGYAGLLLGRPGFDEAATWEAEVAGTGGFLVHGDEPMGVFGNDTATGDLDANGTIDLAVGSVRWTELRSGAQPGKVYVLHGIGELRGDSVVTDVARPLTVIDGAVPADRFGETVRFLGDQDGDGLPELLVEASYLAIDSPLTIGMTYLIPGSSVLNSRTFRRGDANADGGLDLTDAVFILGFLFRGTSEPDCPKSADLDDSGRLELTDAVHLLNFLFRGGVSPSQPFPQCGTDPSLDALTCRSFAPCD